MSRASFLTRGRSIGLVCVFSGIAASGCARNPATGSNQLMLVSESQEIAMGRQADTAVIATIGLYQDATWQRYIQQFGARLAATTERPNLPWTFGPAIRTRSGIVAACRGQSNLPRAS